MRTPVEAKSISSLTGLLSSPPQYPRNPTHEANEPLVLYIVRVPGSRDVFLSPIRPPTKESISLEALQSSLYYLHVDSPEDEVILESLEGERRSQEAQRETVLRKPLPPAPYANYPASNRPHTPPKCYPHYQPEGIGCGGSTQVARHAARGSNLRLNSPQTPPVSRRPAGARPLRERQTTPESDRRSENIKPQAVLNVEGQYWPTGITQVHDPWLPRLHSDVGENGRNATTGSHRTMTDYVTTRPDHALSQTILITLIRRDPTSGSQWNVAKIMLPMISGTTLTLKPVDITMSNPGYGRFARGSHASSDTEESDAVGGSKSSDSGRPSPTPSSIQAQNASTFKRHVGFRPLPDYNRRSMQHIRSKSVDMLNNISNSATRKPRQVFSFLSPWEGLCTFSNGVDGRTLKCKHSLSTNSSMHESIVVPVAELRFNLPWSVLRPRDVNPRICPQSETGATTRSIGDTAKENWRRSVQNFKHKSFASHTGNQRPRSATQGSESAEELSQGDSRFSLQLGREKAGGGFKGDSAKLGKLIIEDEGLKMCDLVVAACMGVWWQHYTDGAPPG